MSAAAAAYFANELRELAPLESGALIAVNGTVWPGAGPWLPGGSGLRLALVQGMVLRVEGAAVAQW